MAQQQRGQVGSDWILSCQTDGVPVGSMFHRPTLPKVPFRHKHKMNMRSCAPAEAALILSPSNWPLEDPVQTEGHVTGAAEQFLYELLSARRADLPHWPRAALDVGCDDVFIAVHGDKLHGHLWTHFSRLLYPAEVDTSHLCQLKKSSCSLGNKHILSISVFNSCEMSNC